MTKKPQPGPRYTITWTRADGATGGGLANLTLQTATLYAAQLTRSAAGSAVYVVVPLPPHTLPPEPLASQDS